MSDEPDIEPRSNEGANDDSDPTAGDESTDEDESGTEIPISTGEDGNDSTNDPTISTDDASENATTEEEIEIAVETGSPGPGVERRSREETGIDLGGSRGGLFDRFDESVVAVLSRVLDTETHLRVYVALRRQPWSTPEEVAEETGLYPRTVRDALGALEAHSAVTRRGPTGGTSGANASGDGNGDGDDDARREPEYAAVAPSAVLTDAVGGTGRGLPEGLDLDRYLGSEPTTDPGGPVRIDVEDGPGQKGPEEPDGSESETEGADERDGIDGRGDDESDGNETN